MSEILRAKKGMLPFFEAACMASDEGRDCFESCFSEDAVLRLGHPFGTFHGAGSAWAGAYEPLARAFEYLDRQEFIRIAGRDADGAMWVGSGGAYVGTWGAEWLDIPATGRSATMRFHEFYRMENGHCVEMQALWDIPELMMQSGVWPMVPQLGRFMHAPAPMTQDGLGPHDPTWGYTFHSCNS